MLSIIEIYLKKHEFPPYVKLINDLIPTFILFFKKISNSQFLKLKTFVKEEKGNPCNRYKFNIFSRKEYINHYKKLKKEYEELFSHLDSDKFIN